MSKKKDPRLAELERVRNIIPRKAGGKFAPGNQQATGRKTPHIEKLAILRSTPARCTTQQMSDELWCTYYVLAKGDLANGVPPIEWAAKLVADKIWPNRHALEIDERMVRLEAELERIYQENPALRPSSDERIGPMKLAVTGG